MSQKLRYLPLLLILLAASVLRIGLATRSGLWMDECLNLQIATTLKPEAILAFIRDFECHPPFYYFFNHFLMSAFGRSDAVFYVPSLILGIGLMVLVYYTANRWFDSRVALVATILTAFSVMLIKTHGMVRPYAILQFLSVYGTYLLWRNLHQASIGRWLLYILCGAVLLFVHNWSVLILASQFAAFALCLILTVRDRGQLLKKGRELVAAFAVILLLYAPWVPALLYQSQTAGYPKVPASQLPGRVWSDLVYAFGFTGIGDKRLILLVVLSAGLVGGAYWWKQRRGSRSPAPAENREESKPETQPRQKTSIVMVVGTVVIAYLLGCIASLKSYVFTPWSVSILLPLVYICFALLLVGAWDYFTGSAKPARGAGFALPFFGTLLCLALLLQWPAALIDLRQYIKSNTREQVASVSERIRPEDVIVFSPEGTAAEFNWYFKESNAQCAYPTGGRLDAVNCNNIVKRFAEPESFQRFAAQLEQYRKEGRRVWLVLDYRGGEYTTWEKEWETVSLDPQVPQKILDDWFEVQPYRARQTYALLRKLYGKPPVNTSVWSDQYTTVLRINTLLFEP